jgi:Ni/Co efflux regulator RcnB
MKKISTAFAAATAIACVVSAVPASAQYRDRYRDSDRDGRSDAREWNRDRDRDGRPDQWDRTDRRSDRHSWRNYGGRYGYDGYRGRWRTGMRYPYYNNRAYYISDYGAYGLPAPRRGYRYYRDDSGDVVMVAIASGLIGAILGSSLSDRDHYRYRRY